MSLPTPFGPVGIFSVLRRHEVRFVAIGGWAAGVQGAAWPTYDVDVVIDLNEDNLQHLDGALGELGLIEQAQRSLREQRSIE